MQVGGDVGMAGSVLGATAFGFNAAGPIGAAIGGTSELLGQLGRRAEVRRELETTRFQIENTPFQDPLQQEISRINARAEERMKDPSFQRNRRLSDMGDALRGVGARLGLGATAQAVLGEMPTIGGMFRTREDPLRDAAEDVAALMNSPMAWAEGRAKQAMMSLADHGGRPTDEMMRRAEDLYMQVAQQRKRVEKHFAGVSGSISGVSK
jgi:hypothetical protein